MGFEAYKLKELITKLPSNNSYEDIQDIANLLRAEIDTEYSEHNYTIDFIVSFANRKRTQLVFITNNKINILDNEINVAFIGTVICRTNEINCEKYIELLKWSNSLFNSKILIKDDIIYLGTFIDKNDIDINKLAQTFYEIALEGDKIEQKFFVEDIY